jgi:tRNA threonylcarbamoyladenosine biosynthesis protein TsaB
LWSRAKVILAINTTTARFGVALLESEGLLKGEIIITQPRGHFGSLMPAVEFLLGSCEVEVRQLAAAAVAIGPGSFTGLRIGISAAKGFSHALGIPVIGVSSLEAMALQAFCGNLPVVALIDSRRDEFFSAIFGPDEKGGLKRLTPDQCVKKEDIPTLFKARALAVGSNPEAIGPILNERCKDKAIAAPIRLWHTGAACVGELASKRLKMGQSDDPDSLTPVYLRPPDIRPNPFPLRDNLPDTRQ